MQEEQPVQNNIQEAQVAANIPNLIGVDAQRGQQVAQNRRNRAAENQQNRVAVDAQRGQQVAQNQQNRVAENQQPPPNVNQRALVRNELSILVNITDSVTTIPDPLNPGELSEPELSQLLTQIYRSYSPIIREYSLDKFREYRELTSDLIADFFDYYDRRLGRELSIRELIDTLILKAKQIKRQAQFNELPSKLRAFLLYWSSEAIVMRDMTKWLNFSLIFSGWLGFVNSGIYFGYRANDDNDDENTLNPNDPFRTKSFYIYQAIANFGMDLIQKTFHYLLSFISPPVMLPDMLQKYLLQANAQSGSYLGNLITGKEMQYGMNKIPAAEFLGKRDTPTDPRNVDEVRQRLKIGIDPVVFYQKQRQNYDPKQRHIAGILDDLQSYIVDEDGDPTYFDLKQEKIKMKYDTYIRGTKDYIAEATSLTGANIRYTKTILLVNDAPLFEVQNIRSFGVRLPGRIRVAAGEAATERPINYVAVDLGDNVWKTDFRSRQPMDFSDSSARLYISFSIRSAGINEDPNVMAAFQQMSSRGKTVLFNDASDIPPALKRVIEAKNMDNRPLPQNAAGAQIFAPPEPGFIKLVVQARVFSKSTKYSKFNYYPKYGFFDFIYRLLSTPKSTPQSFGLTYNEYEKMSGEQFVAHVVAHFRDMQSDNLITANKMIYIFPVENNENRLLNITYSKMTAELGFRFIKYLKCNYFLTKLFFSKKKKLEENSKRRITKYLNQDKRDLSKLTQFLGVSSGRAS